MLLKLPNDLLLHIPDLPDEERPIYARAINRDYHHYIPRWNNVCYCWFVKHEIFIKDNKVTRMVHCKSKKKGDKSSPI